MNKTVLLAATLATVTFGAAQAAGTMSNDVPKTTTVVTPSTAAPMVTAATTPIATTRPGDHLTSEIVGRNVYSKTGEKIGDVNDLLVDGSGKVTGVVIGVGGFLGVGEKAVALPYAALTTTLDDKGERRLTVDVTKDALQKAPTFERAEG